MLPPERAGNGQKTSRERGFWPSAILRLASAKDFDSMEFA
jgi:hypothetical protein